MLIWLIMHLTPGVPGESLCNYGRSLKVLSSEMDPVEIRLIRGFLEKSAHSPSSESPLKYESASYFSTANYAINLDSCGEYSLWIWI